MLSLRARASRVVRLEASWEEPGTVPQESTSEKRIKRRAVSSIVDPFLIVRPPSLSCVCGAEGSSNAHSNLHVSSFTSHMHDVNKSICSIRLLSHQHHPESAWRSSNDIPGGVRLRSAEMTKSEALCPLQMYGEHAPCTEASVQRRGVE